MAKISTNAEITAIIMAEQGSTPSTPASGYSKIFAKADGLYIVDDAGAVTGPFSEASALTTVKLALKNEIIVASKRLEAQINEQRPSYLEFQVFS